MEKFYVIEYDDGKTVYGDFRDYTDAVIHAMEINGDYDFTISEYDSEEEYFDNL